MVRSGFWVAIGVVGFGPIPVAGQMVVDSAFDSFENKTTFELRSDDWFRVGEPRVEARLIYRNERIAGEMGSTSKRIVEIRLRGLAANGDIGVSSPAMFKAVRFAGGTRLDEVPTWFPLHSMDGWAKGIREEDGTYTVLITLPLLQANFGCYPVPDSVKVRHPAKSWYAHSRPLDFTLDGSLFRAVNEWAKEVVRLGLEPFPDCSRFR